MTQFTITSDTLEEHTVYTKAFEMHSTLEQIRRDIRNYKKHSLQTSKESEGLIDSISECLNGLGLE
jgi:hypothetical protein